MSALASLLRSRPHVLAVLLGLAAASTGLSASADGDIWWHLAAGREMVARHGLLFTDPFSLSAAGRPWFDVHWLFQLAVFGLYQGGGLRGLVLAKCGLIGLGAALLFFSLEGRRGSWSRAVLVTALLAALLAARSLLLLRPVIGTLVFLALFFWALESFRRDGRARLLWLLPLAQLLWANLQGLSALGPALVGAYALAALAWLRFGHARGWPFAREIAHARGSSSHARRLLVTLGACLLAACVTPFGLGGATLPARLFGRLLPGQHQVFASQVAENLPPLLLERISGELWHFKWCLLLVAASVLAAGRRLRLSHALVMLGLGGLALLSNRNVLLFYWLGAPIFAINLAPELRRFVVGRWRASGWRVALSLDFALVAALLLTSGTAAAREPTLAEPSPFRAPAESVRRLAALPRGGGVFAADHYGGYLIWRLYPRFRPYIDTRLVLRSADEYAEYLRLADEPERFDAFQARHHFSYVVLPVLFPERYQRLIAHLYQSPTWKLLFTDGSEVLFGRRDITSQLAEQPLAETAESERVAATLQQRFGDAPKLHVAALMSLATLHGVLGQSTQAERVLADIATPEARALEARVRFAAGELDAAADLARERLRAERDDVGSLNLLALIALRRGESSRGLSYLRRALQAQPFDREATELLANLEESRR